MIRKLIGSFLPYTLLAMRRQPNRDELIKKSVDARGGVQKLKAIKSLRMTGKIHSPRLEIPSSCRQRPNPRSHGITFRQISDSGL